MYRDLAYERKEQLRKELKVQLPVAIDSKRYLIGRLAFVDVFLILPFVLLTLFLGFLFYRLGILNNWTLILAALPTVAISVLQLTKHKVRKEISFIKYGVLWKYEYKKRNKQFHNRKGAFDMSDKKDARKRIGIKSVFAECYETNDNRFVRVFEVSSVNLSLSNKSEKRTALESFRVFMTTLNFIKTIQFSQIAQPINLTRHIQNVTQRNQNHDNKAKLMLQKSYRSHLQEIQKSKDLVTRKRYIIISEKIRQDRDDALDKIDQNSTLLMNKIDAMTMGYTTLSIKQLNNDELTKLMYTCVDYDSAVAIGDYIVDRASNRSLISVGEESARRLLETLQKQLNEKIN